MTTGRSRIRLIVSCAATAVTALALAGGAQATEYHLTASDIQTNQGRTCSHGLNGAPRGAVSIYDRDIYSENSVGCGYGSSGQASTLYTNLYLDLYFGTSVDVTGSPLGYGPSYHVGSSSAVGDYTHVEGLNRQFNVPTQYRLKAWDTIQLPTSGTEDFTSWPTSSAYSCSTYYRSHGINGWHRSGLTCFGYGAFTAGVAPYYD